MTSPGRCRNRAAGFILFDVIAALALSGIVIALLSCSTLDARSVYARAVLKREMLGSYQAHEADFEGLLPGQSISREYAEGSSSPAVFVAASARWYGNDRIETDIEASSSGRSLELRAIRKYPFASDADSAGGPLCSPEYTDIASIAPIVMPIDPSLPLTGLQVRDGIAYMTADSNKQSDPDLILVDIHDPKHPQIISSLNTGPGLASLAIAGNYIYAAARSAAAQLHVIRANSPGSLQLMKKYQLPLPEASTSPPLASAISYARGRVYLGTEKWDGQELAVLDVRIPEAPAYLGGFETGSKVNSIFVRDGAAYLAASDQYQLRALDVHGQAPVLRNAFSPTGWQRQEGEAAVSFEDDTAFGRTSGGFDIPSDAEGFFWPEGTTTPFSVNDPGGIYGMVVSRSKVFAITHAPDRELSSFDRDISTTSAAYYSLPVLPQAITCDLGAIYILAKTAPAIYEVTFK